MSNSTNSTISGAASSMFGYDASMPMAWIGGILFSILFVVHLFQYFHYHGYYLYLFMLGLVLEVCGYWTRVLAIKQPDNYAAAGMSYLLITIAPSFFAAMCYMTYGRIVFWVSPEEKRTFRYTWVPARWITTTFVSLDLVGFAISCIGIFVYISNTSKTDLTPDQQRAIPYQVLKVGFFWQIALFSIFTLVNLHFMFASKSYRYDWPNGSGSWRKIAWTIFGAMAILTARSIYRCSSFAINQGDNYLRTHEWTFYMFDFLPIIFLLILWSLMHPANHLPREYTTIGHAYKKSGFKMPFTKEIAEDDDYDSASNRYSRVSLAPPSLNIEETEVPQAQPTGSSMTFNDPWRNRASMSVNRY